MINARNRTGIEGWIKCSFNSQNGTFCPNFRNRQKFDWLDVLVLKIPAWVFDNYCLFCFKIVWILMLVLKLKKYYALCYAFTIPVCWSTVLLIAYLRRSFFNTRFIIYNQLFYCAFLLFLFDTLSHGVLVHHELYLYCIFHRIFVRLYIVFCAISTYMQFPSQMYNVGHKTGKSIINEQKLTFLHVLWVWLIA